MNDHQTNEIWENILRFYVASAQGPQELLSSAYFANMIGMSFGKVIELEILFK